MSEAQTSSTSYGLTNTEEVRNKIEVNTEVPEKRAFWRSSNQLNCTTKKC